MENQSPEIIQVKPKSRFLTAEELFALRGVEVKTPKVGLKKTKPSGTEEEKAELDVLYDELKKQLSCPRIDRIGARTVAEWDSEKCTVRVLKKKGKFQAYGYTKDKVHYLENHEALFLLEMNRLVLYFKGVVVSIEQAYVLLLGEEKSKAYEEYLIYSTLSRGGYIVLSHKQVPVEVSASEEDCIWEIVQSSLDEEHTTPSFIKNSEKYKAVEKSMRTISEKILNPDNVEKDPKQEPSSSNDYINFDKKYSAKRKANQNLANCQPFKKPRTRTSLASSSYLDILKDEPEFEKLQKFFKKFDLIRLKSNQNFDEGGRDFEISFDIYLPNASFSKSNPGPPVLRAIVLGASEDFPTRSELTKVYHRQQIKVPLVVISVSESKHFHAFLYHFT